MATYTVPPDPLRLRVSGNTDGQAYIEVGIEATVYFMDKVLEHTDIVISDVLDWGCGPGRVAMHIPDYCPGIGLYGCDPDSDAIGWAKANLRGEFTVSGLEPPLPYEDESFDAVLGLSVMTHLRRECQLRWLEEICRVLRPGGVLLATVHGKAAHNFFGVEHVEGLDDRYLDPYMAEVLPADYYRTVLQTETYTRDTWSTDEFPVTGYYASAIGNHDLVVLNKK